jgi:hypothetical protein
MNMPNIPKKMERVGEQVSQTASSARSSLIDLGVQALRLANGFREAEARGVTSILSRLGLQRRQSIAVPALCVLAGAAAGAGVALLLAPMKGEDLVAWLSKNIRRATVAAESTMAQHDATMPRDHTPPAYGTHDAHSANGRS